MMAPRAFPSPMPQQHGVGQARLSRTPLGGDTGCSERSWAPLLPRQLFPGFAPRLVPAHVPLPAAVRAPSCPSPPGPRAHRTEPALPGSAGEPSVATWLPWDGLGLTSACAEGMGQRERPRRPGIASPAARPGLVSSWDSTEHFLSLSFLHRHVMNLPHM